MRVEHIGDTALYLGDCRKAMQTMDAGSVQCVVTSPPYWGLRDYGTATWAGGDHECDHIIQATGSTQNKGCNGGMAAVRGDCPKCGASRVDGQIGLEATPDEYVEKMVAVFREVRRVLRDDGTVWLNLGDSYYSTGQSGGTGAASAYRGTAYNSTGVRHDHKYQPDVKPKDLVGIPWRVAFALQADGWYLRQDIIWSKPNPMPESVTDRCTKAHEYIFLLSKAARYFYDADAIKESDSGQAHRRSMREGASLEPSGGLRAKHSNSLWQEEKRNGKGRNKRSVWTVATAPYSAAHFATFPPKLIEPCILAGSRPGDTVLDPFGGSGTTAGVALEHGRKAILCELSEEYGELVQARIESITDAYKQPRLFEDKPVRPTQQELI